MTRYTGRSATYIGSLTLAAKVAERTAAFVQIAVIASIFGATTRSDLYFIASIVPLTLGTVVGEALATSTLPSLVRRQNTNGLGRYLAATFWMSLGTLIVLLGVYLCVVAVVVAEFAPAGTSSLLPWIAFSPTIVTLGLSSYLSSVLLLHERYTWPPFRAAAATAAGLVFIGVSLIFTHSVTLIATSISAGYAVACGLLIIDVRRVLGLSWLQRPGMLEVRQVAVLRRNVGLAIAGGIFGGQSFVLLERALAASLGVGAVSTISYARGVAFTSNIVGQAVAMGLYPGMLRAHEAHDPTFIRGALIRGLRLTLLVSLAVVVFIAVFGGDLVHVLLQRGALNAQDASAVKRSLVAFTPAIVGSILLIVSSRAFYAIDQFGGILWSQLAVLLLYVPLAVALRRTNGSTGLAAAFGVAELIGGIVGVVLAARLVGTAWRDARPLTALLRPSILVVAVLLAVRFAVDRAPLSSGTEPYVGALVGGAATVLAVSSYLLASDWPEAGVLRRHLPGARDSNGPGLA
jgi:putative peptidoglycan lipid II flippase